MTLNEILIAITILIIFILIYMYFEASWLKVEVLDHSFGSSCFKIVYISDIHIKLLRVKMSRISQEILLQQPDIIILGGDYFDNPNQLNKFLSLLDSINIGIPIYMCYGNHDLESFSKYPNFKNEFESLLENRNIKLLTNSCDTILKNEQYFHIIGIDDINEGNPDIEAALKCTKEKNGIKIGFSHNPELVLQIPEGCLDYLFCGHFHGGQIWMPFRLEFTLMRKEQLCKVGILKGMHKLNGIIVYISRGVGCVIFPLRFFSRPEITVIKMPSY